MSDGFVCSRGHAAPQGPVFCPSCGETLTAAPGRDVSEGPKDAPGQTPGTGEAPASTDPAATTSDRPVPGSAPARVAGQRDSRPLPPPATPGAPATSGLRSQPAVLIAAAAIVAVLVVALAVALGHQSNGSSSGSAADGAGGEQQTTHQTCSLQLAAMAAHLSDGSDATLTAEIQVNGENDPFIQRALELYSTFSTDRLQVGKTQAAQNLLSNAARTCSTQLGDQVRENYPSDGSY